MAILNLIDAHHIGRIGDYAEQVAARGLVGTVLGQCRGPPAHRGLTGAKEPRWGTNPHAIGNPGTWRRPHPGFRNEPHAHGKARVALNKGAAVPEGYLIDAQGEPTTDPAVVFPPAPMGALLPFGDHKGAGLAMVVEILSAGSAMAR